MHDLYKLKGMLLKELEEYGTKELTSGSLPTVDTLAHAAKNVCKIITMCEDEEYEASGEDGYFRETTGRSNRRDSRGRYMRSGESGRRYMRGESGGWECYGRSGNPHETVEKLNEMMDETSDKRVKEIIQETIRLVESH